MWSVRNPEWYRRGGLKARGEGNGNARLTEADVKAIRQEWQAMAQRYGISPKYVTQIVLRQRWKHV